MSRNSSTNDDLKAWHTFVKEIKPFKKKSLKIEPCSSSYSLSILQKRPPQKEHLFPEGFSSLSPSKESRPLLLYQGLRKLKRPKTLDATLDLHGMTQKEAFDRLTHFLISSYYHQRKIVLVITGKGLKPNQTEKPGGVLREKLPLWLAHSHLQPLVQYYACAYLQDGGQGAYYIYLKNIKKISSSLRSF